MADALQSIQRSAGQIVAKWEFQMQSKKLEVRFDDQTHEPVEFRNVETDDRLLLTPESAFHLEFYKIEGALSDLAEAVRRKSAELLIMNAPDCQVIAESQAPTSDGTLVRKITWRGAHGKVTVAYTLGSEDHFIQKEIRFEPLFTEPFLLSRVEMQRFGFATKLAEEYILTHFLRGEKSGFFFWCSGSLAGTPANSQCALANKRRAEYSPRSQGGADGPRRYQCARL
jgi:hypothetical protein